MPMWLLWLPLCCKTMIVFKSFRLCHSSCYSSLRLAFVCFVWGLFHCSCLYLYMYNVYIYIWEWISLMCIKFACYFLSFFFLFRSSSIFQPLRNVIATVCNLFHWIESLFRAFSFKCIDVKKSYNTHTHSNDNVLISWLHIITINTRSTSYTFFLLVFKWIRKLA